MTKDELIATLEKATGPDRALDVDIALAVESWPDGVFPMRAMPGQIGLDGGRCVSASSYTASIDAALTLVPENYFWRIHPPSVFPEGKWAAEIFTQPMWGSMRDGTHRTSPAIAICIACLKARTA